MTQQPSGTRPLPTAPSTLSRWFPIAAWLPRYDWGSSSHTRPHRGGHCRRHDVDLLLARVHSGTRELMNLSGFLDALGEDHVHDTVRDAVDAAVAAHADDHPASP